MTPDDPDASNRTLMRWTLAMISWMFALWTGVFALASSAVPGSRISSTLLFVHAAFLGAAGFTLGRPRRGAWVLTLLAALGSLGFTSLDIHLRQYQAAAIDGCYPLLALVIALRCHPRA